MFVTTLESDDENIKNRKTQLILVRWFTSLFDIAQLNIWLQKDVCNESWCGKLAAQLGVPGPRFMQICIRNVPENNEELLLLNPTFWLFLLYNKCIGIIGAIFAFNKPTYRCFTMSCDSYIFLKKRRLARDTLVRIGYKIDVESSAGGSVAVEYSTNPRCVLKISYINSAQAKVKRFFLKFSLGSLNIDRNDVDISYVTLVYMLTCNN